MSSLQDMRSLWKIPPPRKTLNLEDDKDDKLSTFLAKSIGISNPNVIDMHPAKFWKMYLKNFEDISIPPQSVVVIMGDLIRDKSGEKSLP
jgi:hypothetical protein